MKKIAIYVEGGGETIQYQSEIRNGFDILLEKQKQAARQKKLGWKLVPCGGRDQAHQAFINTIRQSTNTTLVVLLVDAEDELPAELPRLRNETLQAKRQRLLTNAESRKSHLLNRDKWDLKKILPECIHLMVRRMEAWIVADPKALANYYGKNFHVTSLPARTNLEEKPKAELYDKLVKATKDTSKGSYAKIKHASKLLGLIDPNEVAAHCPPFATFVSWLDEQIDNA